MPLARDSSAIELRTTGAGASTAYAYAAGSDFKRNRTWKRTQA